MHAGSLDHLVGEREQRPWYREPKNARGPQVDDKLKLGGLHDWQISGLFAAQNAVRVSSDLADRVRKARAVAHQATRHGEIAILEDRGNCVARRERGKLLTPSDKERIGTDQQSAGLHSD